MTVLRDFPARTEVYSIDECFVDLTGMPKLREVSYQMRERAGQWIGMPVCVGIGPTKTLAKLANHVAKKHPGSKGVFNYKQSRKSPIYWESSFRAISGMTVIGYLNTRRLAHARNLLAFSTPHDTVTSIALQSGFDHLGEFSVIYRIKYREKPSDTFRRSPFRQRV